MKKYRLPEKINESIVDGIIVGYKDYLRVRKEAARNLKVHGAYAWVKGNHIDHHVAVQCENHGVDNEVSSAGVTWKYLMFYIKDTNSLFLIKNARYFDPEAVDKGKDTYGKTKSKKSAYMEEFIKINREIEFPCAVINNKSGHSLQLELFEDYPFETITKESASEIAKQHRRFYIVTYEIAEDYLINAIKIWMPNPINNRAYLVQDLSELINTKPSHIIEIEDETKAILRNSEFEPDASLFDIEITDEESDEVIGQ
jgi:hypothetical protein